MMAVEVVGSKGGEFAAAGAGVGDQSAEQLELLGAVPPNGIAVAAHQAGVQLVGLPLGEGQEVADLVDGDDVLAAVALGWAMDAVERMAVQDPHRVGPADRGAQDPESVGHGGLLPSDVEPVMADRGQDGRGEVDRPAGPNGVAAQEAHVRPVPANRRGLSVVVGAQPSPQQLRHGDRGSWPARVAQQLGGGRPVPPGLVRRGTVTADGDRPDRLWPVTGSGPSATLISHTPGRRWRSDPAPRIVPIADM